MKKIKLLSLKNQKAFDFASRRQFNLPSHLNSQVDSVTSSREVIKYSCRFFTIIVSGIFAEQNEICEKITKKNIHDSDSPIFYGFKISKKIGKSHERNLLKRRLKNIYLKFFQVNYRKLSIIFIPKIQIKDLNFDSLEQEMIRGINWCMRKIK